MRKAPGLPPPLPSPTAAARDAALLLLEQSSRTPPLSLLLGDPPLGAWRPWPPLGAKRRFRQQLAAPSPATVMAMRARSFCGCGRARANAAKVVVASSTGGPGVPSPGGGAPGGAGGHGATPIARQTRASKRAKAPGLFEVRVVTPPPRSLGIYALPPLTHNGEQIEVDGQEFVVTSVVVQMKLNKGRYVRDHSRLDVTPTGRWLLNMSLENLLRAKYIGPPGPQD